MKGIYEIELKTPNGGKLFKLDYTADAPVWEQLENAAPAGGAPAAGGPGGPGGAPEGAGGPPAGGPGGAPAGGEKEEPNNEIRDFKATADCLTFVANAGPNVTTWTICKTADGFGGKADLGEKGELEIVVKKQ